MVKKKNGRPPKYDWNRNYKKFLAAKKEDPKLTISGFCKITGYPYSSTQKAFAKRMKGTGGKGKTPRRITRHDWPAYKIEFLSGDFLSLSDFARHKGLNPDAGAFRYATKGWLEQKEKIRAKTEKKAIAEIAENEAVRIQGKIIGVISNIADRLEVIDDQCAAMFENIKEPLDAQRACAVLRHMIQIARDYPAAVWKNVNVDQFTQLNQDLIDGKIDIETAILKIDMMGREIPRAHEMLLKRPGVEEVDIDKALNVPTDKELDTLYEERLAEVKRQKQEFVPKRREEIKQMKEELKQRDSFAHDNQ